MKARETTWAAESPDAPRVGEFLTESATGFRWEVRHVGRLVWLRSGSQGLALVEWAGFWARFDRKQLTLRLLPGGLLLALLATLAGCFSVTGIAVAPNGGVWLAGSIGMEGPAVYSCAPRAGDLHCTRVPLHGVAP